MNLFKKYSVALILLAIVFSPFISSAQSNPPPTITYNHSSVTETSVIIGGQIIIPNAIPVGYNIVFGTIPDLLMNVVPIFPDANGNYSVKINNLSSATTYYYKVVYGLWASSAGSVKSFKTGNPSLILNHKEVTQSGAKLYGTVSAGHPNFIIKYGTNSRINEGTFSLDIKSDGTFEDFFSPNYPPNTTIYYRAADPLLPLLYYSPLKSFKTLQESVNFEFRNITSSSVTIFGNVTVGTPPIKVLWNISGLTGQVLENDPVLNPDNTWSVDITGLESNMPYFVRVTQRSNPTYIYLEKSFTTFSSDIVLQFFNITDSSMKVSGRIPVGIPSVLLCFATNKDTLSTAPDCGSGPVFAVEGSEVFEQTITNLAPNTTYYFVVRNSANIQNLSEVFEVQTFPTSAPSTSGGGTPLPQGPDSLVPCDGLDCDFAALVKLINNVIDFLLKTVAMPLFALIFAYVGWLYMSSADDPGKRTQAKGILKNAVFGFIIAMAAFVIIKAVLYSLGYTGISFGIL